MGNTRADKAKIMFATHPKVDEFYVTSNDKFFYTEQDAESAAQLLEDKKVAKLERTTVPANEELEKDIESSKANGNKPKGSEDDAQNNPDGSQGEEGSDSSQDDEPSKPENTEGADNDQPNDQDVDQKDDQADQSENDKDDQADQSEAKSLESLKEEYKALTGNPAHHTWDAKRIEEKIAEAKAKASDK